MSERVLTMLEVSQKQAYIFASNKLRDNIMNSAVISWVMSKEYFEEKIHNPDIFDQEKNYVYAGGGHTVLEFPTLEKAFDVTKKITTAIHCDYPEIQVFAASLEYDSTKSPGENLKELTKKLERKKSIRESVFHQGTFGIEKLDTVTHEPILLRKKESEMPEKEQKIDKELSLKEYRQVFKFEDLGGSKEESNFIAVVHIDGNAMGTRVGKIYEEDTDWTTFKNKIRKFSNAIDKDFKDAYIEMINVVANNIKNGGLKDLNLKDNNFPVRRIITAGDDVCYVTEGRIGIESAAVFLKALSKKKNPVDQEFYSACAGVAVVHQKYPFYKAYELAEMLCSNAKRFGANLSKDQTGKEISCIGWHIDFGELKDTLSEIRKEYLFGDNKSLELRPYLVEAPEEILEKEPIRQYVKFKSLFHTLFSKDMVYARGKIKELRSVLKKGEDAVQYYLKFNKMEDIARDGYQDIFVKTGHDRIGTGEGLERKVYVKTEDGVKRCLLFDAIEIMDTYIELEN